MFFFFLFLSFSLALVYAGAASAAGVAYAVVDGARRDLTTVSISIEVEIEDRLAVTRIVQAVANTTGRDAEVLYDLQLPSGASLTDLAFTRQQQKTWAYVLARDAVRRNYRKILAQPPAPLALGAVADDLLRLYIRPFRADAARVITTEWMQVLSKDGARAVYRLPLPGAGAALVDWRAVVRSGRLEGVEVAEQQGARTRGLPEGAVEIAMAERAGVEEVAFAVLLRRGVPGVVAAPPAAGDDGGGYWAAWLPAAAGASVRYGAGIDDVWPRQIEAVDAGGEVLQTGRYRQGGEVAVEVSGGEGAVYALRLPEPAPAGVAPARGELLYEDFSDGQAAGWDKAWSTWGRWRVDPAQDTYKVGAVNGIARAFHPVAGSMYTIETRMRFGGLEGKVIFAGADRNEDMRLDLMTGGHVRLQTLAGLFWTDYPIAADTWYEVRLEVGAEAVDAFVDGDLLHYRVPLAGLVPDGVIGIGSYGPRHQAEFDYVRVTLGTDGAPHFAPLQPAARLWASQRVAALDAEVAEYGPNPELRQALAELAHAYRLPSGATALFALDDEVVVNPGLLRDWPADVPTAVADSAVLAGDPVIEWGLEQNAPNPFNAATEIRLRAPGGAALEIYDLLGQRIRFYPLAPGARRVVWDGRDQRGRQVASGVYVYRLGIEGRMLKRRMLLLR